MPPLGDWLVWLLLAGRGFGKTRTGAEWVRAQAESGEMTRIALVAPTIADIRNVMIEGESGILACCPPWNKPVYEPSKRHRLTWPNGAMAFGYSADEPERLRGPQHDGAWCDEIAAWRYPETWDMLQFGLRLGANPRAVVTTTPKPLKLVRELLASDSTTITAGTTYDNRANLASSFFRQIVSKYEGTRLGRQELLAELLDDVPGALWTVSQLDQCRLPHNHKLPDMQRVVVAIDPSGTKGGDNSDDVGIIVAGKGVDGRGYILADRTCNLSPAGWGKRAVDAYHEFGADRIVAERNFGGAMVQHVIRTADPNVSYREVTASRGKVIRAEPVAALYEQRRIDHAGNFPDLETQMCAMTGTGYLGKGSPDRVDALVWAITDLMLTGPRGFTWNVNGTEITG